MESPDYVSIFVFLIILIVPLSVVFFGLMAAGFCDDFNRWRNRKKGVVHFAFPSFREWPETSEDRALLARYDKTVSEAREETLQTGVE